MQVKIQFCWPCGYRKIALRLANRVERELGTKPELIGGNFGVFKIWVNDQLIFNKYDAPGILGKLGFGPIPADNELLDKIQSAGSNGNMRPSDLLG